MRQVRSRPYLLLWLGGTSLFRAAFPIFTHNSITLSLYVSAIFVVLPTWTVIQVLGVRSSQARGPGHLPRVEIERGRAFALDRRRKPSLVSVLLAGLATLWVFICGIVPRRPDYSLDLLRPGQKYFIAANFWDNEAILPSFFAEILALVYVLGPDNVFLSLAENDSRDDTRPLLVSFSKKLDFLHISHRLSLQSGLRSKNRNGNLDVPWLSVSDRMDYMADIRNTALEPLYTSDVLWDRILFFNDVVFHHSVPLALLGVDGEVVCPLDLESAGLYDLWVLKDRCGAVLSGMWPYFPHLQDREHILRKKPFEVGNCWNGLASLNAHPFLNASVLEAHSIPTFPISEPLRFPHSTPGCFQSECTSLPLAIFNVTDSTGPKAVVHPDAIVGYTKKWHFFYAVVLRMRAVEWWVDGVERYWARAWWWIEGLTKWKGINVEDEVECKVTWGRCDRTEEYY